MNQESQGYQLFFNFIVKYADSGFKEINQGDPQMIALEKLMEKNDQFFYIADIISLEVLFTSKRSLPMLGVKPSEVNPYFFMEATHPDDLQRLNLGRSSLIHRAQDLFIAKKGHFILSTDFRIRNAEYGYKNFLIQCFLFFYPGPHETVYFLKIHSNIEWYKKGNNFNHFYSGTDYSYFRYPDKELLDIGINFSGREIEIIKLVEHGLTSIEIGIQLNLSKHTVDTHRRNILHKAGKAHMSVVVHDLKDLGLL